MTAEADAQLVVAGTDPELIPVGAGDDLRRIMVEIASSTGEERSTVEKTRKSAGPTRPPAERIARL
jgi:hypothetical protein